MAEQRREITGDHSLLDLRMGRPYSPTDQTTFPTVGRQLRMSTNYSRPKEQDSP